MTAPSMAAVYTACQHLDPDSGALSGREQIRRVGFVASGQIFDLALGGHVVMSLLSPAAA